MEVKIPVENVNDLTAKILTWRVASGSAVKQGQALGELETSKATFEVPSPCDGVVAYSWPEGSEVPIGETLCTIDPKPDPTSPDSSAPLPAKKENQPMQIADPVPASAAGDASTAPLFSRKAEELILQAGLGHDLFKGMALVTISDVQAKLSGPSRPSTSLPTAPVPDTEAIKNGGSAPFNQGEAENIPLPRAKLFENRELLAADRAVLKSSIAFFCPAGGLDIAGKEQTPPVGRLPLILYETAKLLKQFRQLNAYFADDHARLYREVHLGFAVDMGRGLKVLVIPNADRLSFPQLTSAFDELLVKYATDSLQIHEVSGSTFTVTDLSQEGVFNFEPLINTRQAAILGMGGEHPAAQPLAGGFMLNCAFDHRLIGGRQVAEFLRELSTRLVAHRKSFQTAEAGSNPPSCSRCLQTVVELRKFGAMLVRSIEPEGYLCSHCIRGLT